MPELPEVETMRRGILGAVGGKVVLVENIRCPKKPITILPSVVNIRRSIVGSTISAIERIGKRVVVVLQDKDNPSQDGHRTNDPDLKSSSNAEAIIIRVNNKKIMLDEIMSPVAKI